MVTASCAGDYSTGWVQIVKLRIFYGLHVEKEIKEFLQQVQRGNKYLKALCQYSRKRRFVSAIAYLNSDSLKQTSL